MTQGLFFCLNVSPTYFSLLFQTTGYSGHVLLIIIHPWYTVVLGMDQVPSEDILDEIVFWPWHGLLGCAWLSVANNPPLELKGSEYTCTYVSALMGQIYQIQQFKVNNFDQILIG